MKNKTQKTVRKDSLQTKQKLVDAAERLFAEQDVERVNLVDVSKEAGQKNRNAAQYHFGDRAGLITAVLNRHADVIAEQRRQALASLGQQDKVTMKALVAVLVLPVVEHVKTDPHGLSYLRLNRQLVCSSYHNELSWHRVNDRPEVEQLLSLMMSLMKPHSKNSLRAKMVLMQSMLFHGLTSFYDFSSLSSIDEFVETLCMSIEAVLLAGSNPK